MRYVIGIDGGGTKTEFLCMSEKGEHICQFVMPSVHVLTVEKQQAISILQEGIKAIHAKVNSSSSSFFICAGLAGYGENKKLRKAIEEICEEAFSSNPYCICSDAEIALEGAFQEEDGIMLICGTGSIAIAKVNQQQYRCGGWGFQLGDEGSGYWLGKRLLQEYTKQCDGRSEKTQVVPYLKSYLQLEKEFDLISYVSSDQHAKREHIASFAPCVRELVKQKDTAAIQIYQEAAKELASLISALSIHFFNSINVCLVGGIWKENDELKHFLRQYCNEKVVFQEVKQGPCYGACTIARKKFIKIS